MFAVFHGNLYIADHGLQHLQLCPLPVTCIDNIPWSRRCIGILHILAKNLSALLIMIILPEIIFIDSPSGILTFQKDTHTFFLFFPVNLHKKFQEHISVIRQLTFKSPDTVNSFCIIVTLQFFIHTFSTGLIHPS